MTYRDDEDDDERYDERPRRDSLMQRRLRAAKGEQVDDDLEQEDEPRGRLYRRAEDDGDAQYGRGGYALPPVARGGCLTSLLYLAIGAVAVAALFLLFGRQLVGSVADNVVNQVPERIQQVIATPTPKLVDRGGTITQIRSLNRLETQNYSIERVIEAGIERGNALDFLFRDKLLLVASGDVVAGVDLAKLKEADVTISADGETISIRLPASEIFSVNLNSQRTRVYDRQTGVLADQNKDLESQARVEAETQILQAACENGVMQKSADEARRSIEQLLRLLSFTHVEVTAAPGTCVRPGA